jgi:hypothetical protein
MWVGEGNTLVLVALIPMIMLIAPLLLHYLEPGARRPAADSRPTERRGVERALPVRPEARLPH